MSQAATLPLLPRTSPSASERRNIVKGLLKKSSPELSDHISSLNGQDKKDLSHALNEYKADGRYFQDNALLKIATEALHVFFFSTMPKGVLPATLYPPFFGTFATIRTVNSAIDLRKLGHGSALIGLCTTKGALIGAATILLCPPVYGGELLAEATGVLPPTWFIGALGIFATLGAMSGVDAFKNKDYLVSSIACFAIGVAVTAAIALNPWSEGGIFQADKSKISALEMGSAYASAALAGVVIILFAKLHEQTQKELDKVDNVIEILEEARSTQTSVEEFA